MCDTYFEGKVDVIQLTYPYFSDNQRLTVVKRSRIDLGA